MQTESGTTGGAAHVGGCKLALLGEVADGITEVLGDEFIGLVLGGTSYTFSLTGGVEMIHYYQAAIEFGQLEIIVTAEEAGLSHEVGTRGWRHNNIFIAESLDCNIAVKDGLVAILVEVARGAVLLTVWHVLHECAVVAVLSGVAHPGVIGAHLDLEPGVVDLPPVVACDPVVQTVDIVLTFLLGGEIVIAVLLATRRFVQEVVAGAQQECRTDGCQYR